MLIITSNQLPVFSVMGDHGFADVNESSGNRQPRAKGGQCCCGAREAGTDSTPVRKLHPRRGTYEKKEVRMPHGMKKTRVALTETKSLASGEQGKHSA